MAGWWVWHVQGRRAGLRPRRVGGAVSNLKAVLRQNSLFLGGISIFFPKLQAFNWSNEAHLPILFFFLIYLAVSDLSVALRFLFSCRTNSPTACGILVHWPRIEPASPALEGRFLTTGLSGEVPTWLFLCHKFKMQNDTQQKWVSLSLLTSSHPRPFPRQSNYYQLFISL